MNRSVVVLSLLAVACLAVPVMAAPIAIANAGFEDDAPASTDDQFGGGLVGWSLGEWGGIFGGHGWYNASETHYVGEQGDGAHKNVAWAKSWYDSFYIYQVLADTYVEGNTYTFSLDVGNAFGYEYTPGTGVGADLVLADEAWGTNPANVLATQFVVAPTAGAFVRGSLSYTATAADAGKHIVVGFRATQAPEWSEKTDFDNAALEVTAVPEPATMSLLVLGGLCALIRRVK